MRRWTSRALPALILCITLPAAADAQPPSAALPPPSTVAPPAASPNGTVVVVPNGVIYMDPYHAASPYNPTVVNQAIPTPMLNRPNTTLPCINPNQNFDPYELQKPGCGHKWWFKKKSGCGCEGACSKGGSCTTCCNTDNFIFGSSRSFFGESAREFFERPPAPDGIKMVPKAYYPPPAPGASIPAPVVIANP